jgi:DNA-binding NarL/FixJ family response regulator
MADRIRVVIAENHDFYREGLRIALAKEPGLQLVAEAKDGVSALERISSLKPDLAIVDIGLPLMNGVSVVKELRRADLPIRIVFLTVCDEQAMFDAALDLGVKGYLLKDQTSERDLLSCVSAVMAGEYYTSSKMTTYLVDSIRRSDALTRQHPALWQLTPQERAVLKRIARRQTSKEIGQALGIATKTVDAHRLNICKKLDLHGNYRLRQFAWDRRHDL